MWIDDTTSLSREASGGWRRSCGPTLVGLASLITYNYSGLASWGSNRRIFILNSSARFKVSEERVIFLLLRRMDIYGHASILWIINGRRCSCFWCWCGSGPCSRCRLCGWLLPDCAMADLAGCLPGFLPGFDGGSRCLLDVFGAPAAPMATRLASPAKGVHKLL